MQPKSPSILECPVGRAVETVGEWWSILILRDAFQGATKFDEFSQSLGIAPNILSRRLAHLTASGMFMRRRYQERPPRYEYVLTDKARDFFPVIATLLAWGNKHLAPKGEAILLANRSDARPFDPVVVDAADMQPITLANAVVIAGPRASRGMRARLASLRAMNPAVAPVGDRHASYRRDGNGRGIAARLRGRTVLAPVARGPKRATSPARMGTIIAGAHCRACARQGQ